MPYNAFCFKCHKKLVVEKEKDPCPHCGGKLKVLGKKTNLMLKGPNTRVF